MSALVRSTLCLVKASRTAVLHGLRFRSDLDLGHAEPVILRAMVFVVESAI
jgi:hypothetical protein